MATLTGKAVSELPAATAANDADLFAISQSGASKKITKSALLGGYFQKIAGTANKLTGDLYIKSSVEDGYTPSSAAFGNRIFFDDNNSANIGYMGPYFTQAGVQGMYLVARRTLGGTPRNNYLLLANDSTGNPVVQVTAPAVWRDAIGVGTVESGSNYCKMPDGTLICWGAVSNTAQGYGTMTFPETFISIPNVTATPYYSSGGGGLNCRVIVQPSTTGGNIYFRQLTSTAISTETNQQAYYTAIGRWK